MDQNLTPEQQYIDARIAAKARALIDTGVDLADVARECEAQIATCSAELGAAKRTSSRTEWLSGHVAVQSELLKAIKLAQALKAKGQAQEYIITRSIRIVGGMRKVSRVRVLAFRRGMFWHPPAPAPAPAVADNRTEVRFAKYGWRVACTWTFGKVNRTYWAQLDGEVYGPYDTPQQRDAKLRALTGSKGQPA